MKNKATSKNDFREAFPIIRIGYDKRLIGSNLTALPLLGDWKCRQGNKLPTGLLKAYPEIEYAFNDLGPTQCKVQLGELQIWFDIVPFPEAGYVGMYGFHIESLVPDVKHVKSRMAA